MPALDNPKKQKGLEDDPAYLRQRIAEIEREAYERGYSAGESAGLEMAEQKAAVSLNRIEDIIKNIISIRDGLIKEIEPQMLELASAIAKKIIIEELTVRPEVIVTIVKEAMRRIERTGRITIKINPSLYDLFMKLKPELLELYPDIVFDVDPSASATGPVVMGHVDEVVTDIDVQITNVIEDIGGEIGSN